MSSNVEKPVTALSFGLLAVVAPILAIGGSHLVWSVNFIALLALCVLLAAMLLQKHVAILAGAALVCAIIASSGQWILLPLVVAQIGLAWIISTQSLTHPVQVSGLLILAAFMQVALTMTESHVLTSTFLLDLGFGLLPFILAAFARQLPLPVIGLGEIVIVVAAYVAQRFTLIPAFVTILWTLLPAKRKRDWPEYYWLGGALLVSILVHLSMLHG
ncbi:hypothetical protein [Lacticaseibacillus zhaodongensis]|uniref:hypothetical protein n=1 Tax=Lacticaseibacillus zhaodongensis TaxID=2668065 RepID=UPI0012D36A99|nr:hypothetical protein [Lacticaseibacillus zhaodongensis]